MRGAAARLSRGSWLLSAALAAVLALIAAVAVVSTAQLRRVEDSVAAIDRNAERAAYLVGDARARLARMWAESLDSLTEQGPELDEIVASIHTVDQGLTSDLEELPQILPADAARRWHAITPDLLAQRHTLERAVAARQAGRRLDAERILDDVEELHERASSELQSFAEAVHAENRRALEASQQDMSSARALQFASFVALFVATAAIGFVIVNLLERQRRQAAAHLAAVEAVNRDLEAFAGRVAHDLKNILAPIGLSVPLLRAASTRPETLENVAARIERSSRRAIDLLEGLLAFARAGAPAAGNERASPARELRGVLEDLAPLIQRNEAEVEVDVDPDAEVHCSPALLHVVLLNLVNNAVKFLDGRPERRVRVSAHRASDACRIEVEDTGPGIPPELVERIFLPFYRAPGAGAAGTGIGLATVHRVVDAYGGTVSVDSVEGRGSTFCVVLPAAPVKAVEASGSATPAPPPAATTPPRSAVNT